MKYQHIQPKEAIRDTLDIIHINWNIVTDKYRERLSKKNAGECKIYMRGQYWIIEHEGIILYYEFHHKSYPFFEMAFHYMNPEEIEMWKTVDELITFRIAIREATVQGTDYVNSILKQPLTKEIYLQFMELARAHDLIHHGSNTF